MKNCYLYHGLDEYRLKESLAKTLQQWNSEVTIIDCSAKKIDIQQVLLQIGQPSLFAMGDKQIYILKQPSFMIGQGNLQETDLKVFLDVITHLDQDSVLIFDCIGYQLDKRKKWYKALSTITIDIHMDLMKPREFEAYVEKELKKHGYQFTFPLLQALYERLQNDTQAFHDVLNKFDLYGQKSLNMDLIDGLVPFGKEVNIFAFSSYFMQGAYQQCLSLQKKMLQHGYTVMDMLMVLASKLRSYYIYKAMFEDGFDQDMIATRLKVHPYAVKVSLQDVQYRPARSILECIDGLAELEQGIKQGKIESNLGFDLWVMKYIGGK